jgi:uncharacterized protein (DUF885 family)
MKLSLLLDAIAITSLCAVVLSAADSPSADAKLEAFFRQYLDQTFALRPLDATRLGEHRFDDRLDDLSAGARQRWRQHVRNTLQQLPQAVAKEQLSAAGQVDFEILQHELTRTLWLIENTSPFEEDPRVYNEYISDSVYLLLAQSTLPKEQNLSNAIARMAQIPNIVAAARENLRNPSPVATETAIRQNRGSIAFYQRELFEVAGETPQLAALQAAAAPVVACLQQYQEFLERDLLPRAQGTGNWAATSLPKNSNWS